MAVKMIFFYFLCLCLVVATLTADGAFVTLEFKHDFTILYFTKRIPKQEENVSYRHKETSEEQKLTLLQITFVFKGNICLCSIFDYIS